MYQGNHYQLMAEYNRWMNQKLYAVCSEIPDDKRKADLGAFFKSIHGTLNHILWGDRVAMRRFTQHPFPLTPIGVEIYSDFTELRVERETTDESILNWVRTLREDWLAQPLEFWSPRDGQTRRGPAWLFVIQMFNHQTHHRGQITTLMKQLGYEPGVTDIHGMPGAIEYV